MHHELFLALLGHPGDVVEARRDGFFIRADVAFLAKPQKTLLNRLLALGHAFATLEAFVRRAEQLPSIYVRALAQGIDDVLQEYTDAVVALERKVLAAKSVFPLPQMVYELEAFSELLPELCKLVRKLDVAGAQHGSACVAGAQLLDLLHRATTSGFPRIRHAMQTLLYCCNRILFKQILAWVLYGEIADPYHEFFVRKTAASTSTAATAAAPVDPGALAWHRQFSLDLDAVPLAYFPLAVAESVLFIGKSMQILVRANEYSLDDAQALVETVAALAHERVFDAVAVEHAVESVRRHIAARLHKEVVVKAGFPAFLAALKGFYLLARGELFQAFIERTYALMTIKPSHKSEDDLNHVVWQPLVRDMLSSGSTGEDDASIRQLFSIKLPLQSFAFRGFTNVDGLVLVGGLVRDAASKSLEVRRTSTAEAFEQQQPTRGAGSVQDSGSGAVWWKHVQYDATAFSSEYVVDLCADARASGDDSADRSALRRVALLFKNDSAFVAPATVDGAFRIDQAHVAYVAIECAIESAPSDEAGASRDVSIVAQVTASRARDDAEVRTSVRAAIPMANTSRITFQLQYARQEFRATAADAPSASSSASLSSTQPQLMYKKVLLLLANGVVVMETKFDFPQALALQASGSEYWLGLALTPCVRLAEWSVDKYSPKATWTAGTLLRAQNASLSPRELWSCVRLDCDVPWPLQLLVTRDTLRSYAHLFQFCFRLKRVAHALERTWKASAFRAPSRAASHACALRGRMSFVVRNIELYFQVFVIESSFRKCVADVDGATDFDRVKRIHDSFVAALVKKCYLHTRTVASALDDVVASCWKFVEYVVHQDSARAALSFDRVAVLDQEFQRRFEFFYGVLQHSDARDLIFLLDYNDFFSTERELRKQQRAGGVPGPVAALSSVSRASALP